MAAGDATTVLAIDSAVGVLVATAERGQAERDALVESHLRALTGRADIDIERRPSGRPRLAPPYLELSISLSRRDGLVLAAFSPDRRVGADLESYSLDLDVVSLSRDHYAPAEVKVIEDLDLAAARDVFLRLWVAKEAALKITGRGIYDGLGEPDCASVIDRLHCDGAIAVLPASARLPALRLAVRTCRAHDALIYCALAVEG